MNRNIKVFVAFLCSWMLAGIPLGSMAAGIPTPPSGLAIDAPGAPTEPVPPPVPVTPPPPPVPVTPPPPPVPVTPPPPPVPVTPPGNDGLLSGMTPGNYKLPSGWSMVRATDFEGTKPVGETWAIWQGSVQTDRYHTGAKSVGGKYSADQNDVSWRLSSNQIGTFTEVYLSFYEYIESQALFNDEFFLARFAVSDPFQEVLADWYWAPGFNKPNATLYVVPQGVRTWRGGAKSATVPKGAWHQWEIHYRPNTSGASNGFYRVYLDGRLFTSVENANLNGTRSMTNMSIHVGGTYTKLVWLTDHPTCSKCSSKPGEGTDYCTASMKWSGQSFSSPKCNPIDPPLPSFNRYFDDIIVMKK